ncbi:YihY/virulence factor BrkB family protein [Rhodanobacter sp. L36]|uniref:YihY/virulence factor BrkB family protein n=1 Tax=Rhodanobacter sp. L36 TaxID=1747221 RepID=UPI00131D68A4|nr:YihY/virulence factor BrkB family protein [Rhodanobacter sp. L36]
MRATEQFKLTFKSAIAGIGSDEVLTRAAALAFYSALSFAPLIVLLLWVLAALRPEWQGELTESLAQMVGRKGADAVTLIVQNAKSRPTLGNVAGIIGLVVTLFSASAVFAQLQITLNRIWRLRTKPKRAVGAWLRARGRAFGLLLGMTFLLIVSFAISALIKTFVPGSSGWWTAIENLISTAVFLAAFGAMYRVLPDAQIAWADAVRGAVVTTVLFLAGKYLIDLYIRNVSVGGAYGPAGALVVLLTWVYYASTVVLLGAEITHAYSIARGEKVQPDAHAELIDDTGRPVEASTEGTDS